MKLEHKTVNTIYNEEHKTLGWKIPWHKVKDCVLTPAPESITFIGILLVTNHMDCK